MHIYIDEAGHFVVPPGGSHSHSLKLFFPSLPVNNEVERKAKTMMGHRVIATGILHRSDTVGEITPIYMNVTELQPVQPSAKP